MKENWKVGKHPSEVVSDTKQRNTNFPTPPNAETSEDGDVEYYGGYLVCESVGSEKQARLIAAAPDLYEALKEILPYAMEFINENHPAYKKATQAILKASQSLK